MKIFGRDKKTLKESFWWAIHNVVAHPTSEILYWLYLQPIGDMIHDWTIPKGKNESNRIS